MSGKEILSVKADSITIIEGDLDLSGQANFDIEEGAILIVNNLKVSNKSENNNKEENKKCD